MDKNSNDQPDHGDSRPVSEQQQQLFAPSAPFDEILGQLLRPAVVGGQHAAAQSRRLPNELLRELAKCVPGRCLHHTSAGILLLLPAAMGFFLRAQRRQTKRRPLTKMEALQTLLKSQAEERAALECAQAEERAALDCELLEQRAALDCEQRRKLLQLNIHVNVVVIGHLNSGKSTTAGHLIYECGGIDQRVMEEVEGQAEEKGKCSSKYAWLLDRLAAERENNITIDTALWRFETNRYHVTAFDAPGDRAYIKNLITGTYQADCAVLVVSCAPEEFEASFSNKGQTREHALLARAMGVKQLVVACNKMDTTEPPFSEDRYTEVMVKVSSFIKSLRYNPAAVPFVPISGFHGDNLVKASDRMPWYKGWNIERNEGNTAGKTLLEALDAVLPPQRPTDKALRLPIRDMYEIGGIGLAAIGNVATGKVTSQMLKRDFPVYIAPQSVSTYIMSLLGICTDVKSAVGTTKARATEGYSETKMVEVAHEPQPEALPGHNIGLVVKDVAIQGIGAGSVVSDTIDSAKEAKSFIAQVVVVDHPGITVGYKAMVHCHYAHVECEFVELQQKLDRRSGNVVEDNPTALGSRDAGIVKLVPTKPMCLEKFDNYAPLGRIAVLDMEKTVAVGVVKDVEKSESGGGEGPSVAVVSRTSGQKDTSSSESQQSSARQSPAPQSPSPHSSDDLR